MEKAAAKIIEIHEIMGSTVIKKKDVLRDTVWQFIGENDASEESNKDLSTIDEENRVTALCWTNMAIDEETITKYEEIASE